MSELTLTDFLLARIAEDEAVARDAAEDGARWAIWFDCDGFQVEDADGWAGQYRGESDVPEYLHMERHDPARVLAECAAKRRIVEASADAARSLERQVPGLKPILENSAWDLRNIATVYADHPDYRQEWKL